MNKKAALVLEYMWLILGIITLASGIYETIRSGFSEAYLFFIMTVISLFMFSYRRRLRKSRES
jgi:ABC-type Fe3+ transport system permease subunit